MAGTTAELKTTGMHCSSCSMLIEMNVGEMGGVQDVSIDLAKGMTTVTFDDALASVDDIVAQIESAGYGVER